MLDDGRFQINDIVLNIPPTEIKISRNSFDQRLDNLRTVGSSVLKSNFSNLNIQFSAVFTDQGEDESGFEDLRNLVAQFRLTPFCYVENRFLGESIFGDADKSKMTLALVNMTISMAAGDTINAIKVLFSFNYFNHTPYVHEFRYRKSIFLDVTHNTLDPRESEAWKMFYKSEQDKRDYMKFPFFTGRDGEHDGEQLVNTTLEYYKYRIFTTNELKTRMMEVDTLLKSAPYTTETHDQILQMSLRPPGDSWVTPRTELKLREDYLALTNEQQLGNFKLEIESAMIKAGDIELSPLQIVSNSERWSLFAENIPDNWEAITLKDGNFATLTLKRTPTSTRNATLESKDGDLILCRKKQSLDLDSDKIVPIGISINFSNRLATIPLIGGEDPTFQYLGGSDATVSMSFMTTDNVALEKLSRFHSIWKEQRLLMRSIPTGLKKITIVNDLLNMCGLHTFLLQAIDIGTVPGQPETKQISLDLIENAKPDLSEEKITYEPMKPGYNAAKFGKTVFNYMINYLDRAALNPSNTVDNQKWIAHRMFDFEWFGNKRRVSLKLDFVRRWNSWVKDDEFKWFTDADIPGKIEQQIIKERNRLKTLGNYSRHTWVGDKVEFGKVEEGDLPPSWGAIGRDTYSLKRHGDRAQYSGTAKYTDWMTSIGNNQELDSIERNVLYRLKKYPNDNALTSWAVRRLLLDFDVIFSKFVIGLLDYYQGVETLADSGRLAFSAGRDVELGMISEPQSRPINAKAYAAEHVLKILTNKDLIGIEEAFTDVKAIIKNVSLGDNAGIQFYDWRQKILKNTNTYMESKEGRKKQIEQKRYVRSFFNESFVMEYRVNIKGLIKRVTSSSLFMDLPEFAHIRDAIAKAKVGAGTNTYPDFPMGQFLDRVRNHELGKDYLEKLEDKISMLNEKFMAGHKFISVDTFFGPDLYICDIPVFVDQLLDTSILTDASNSIINSYSGKEGRTESINSWLVDTIDENTSKKRRDNLSNELRGIGRTEAGSGEVSTASKLRAARNNPNAFLENQGYGESVPGAAVENEISINVYDERVPDRENKKDAVVHKIKSMQPIKNHSEYQSMLKTKYENIAGLTKEQLKVIQLPQFIWPTRKYKESTGISTGYHETARRIGRKHTALDIVSSRGDVPTDTLPIYASASGTITSITKLDIDTSTGKYSNWLEYTTQELSKEVWSGTNRQIFKGKSVEYSKGTALRGGLAITIEHEGGWTSYYGHVKKDSVYEDILQRWETARKKLEIKQGDHIGTIGNTGRSTGAHLHFQLKKNGEPQNPKKLIIEKKLEKKAFPPGTYTPTSQPLNKAFEQLQTSLNNQRGLIRAYPTYKLFFIESDAGERHFFGFDDFFSYQAVQDIQLIRSANNPADLLIVKLTNLSGYLTNRRFKDIRQNQNKENEVPLQASPIAGNDQDGKAIRASENVRDMMHADTITENPIESLFLKEGTQIQLRMGYSPNPSELENVFDGLIMDIQFHNTDDVITLVCQSYGMELAAGVIGLNEPEIFEKDDDDEKDRSRTGVIMEELLAYPELKHFGRYEQSATITGGGGSRWRPWELVGEIMDSNIFPPVVGLEDRSTFFAYKTTIWDIAQELTHRHPGYITYPVSYDGEWGPRMTLFFGLPSGSYVARDANWDEQETIKLIELINRQETQGIASLNEKRAALDQLLDPSISGHDAKLKAYFSRIGEDVWADQTFWSSAASGKTFWHTLGMEFAIADKIRMFAKEKQIIKPFRKYHLISSEHNLIANNIISSAYSTFNAATIEYSKSDQEVENEALQFGSPDTLSVIADSSIPEEETRELYAGFENCYGREQAKRYAQSLLWKSMKKGYRGSFTICGNPEIKPYDVCYVYDTYTDMHGPIEVEQVIHRFSHQTGFVTEIVPMMCVHTNETATMPTMDVIGMMAENWLWKDVFRAGKFVSKYEETFAGGFMSAGGATSLMAVKGAGVLAGVLMDMTGIASIAIGGVAATAVTTLGWAALVGGLIYSGVSLFGILDDDPDEEGSTGLLDDLGLFMFRKHITRTQMAHLFEYSPLIVRGRPLLGGLPTRTKDPGSFMQGWWEGKVKWWNEGNQARPILDFELQMLNNPENFPDYNTQNLRGFLGEPEE